MSAINRKVLALHPSSKTNKEGIIIKDSFFRKMYLIEFEDKEYWVNKSNVQFLPA